MKQPKAAFWCYTFCCLAFVSTFGWYSLYQTQDSGEYSSLAEEQVIKKIEQANQAVVNMTPSEEDMTCSCQFGETENVLKFETPEECGEDRNYFKTDFDAFRKIDPKKYYMGPRDFITTASVLPRKCALYIMKRFWRNRALTPEEKLQADLDYNSKALSTEQRPIKPLEEYKEDIKLFAKCEKEKDGSPERYGHKACVTEDYVNLVYNALLDVSDCLDVPAKFIAPKLSNESGLHVNAYGPVNDGGIGQFTDQALQDVAQSYDKFKSKITGSAKESCKRLRSIPGALPKEGKDILYSDANRCHAISAPPNPLRSLLYYGVFYHTTKRRVTTIFERAEDSKDPNFKSTNILMDEAGISNFDKEKIQEMLFVMAYNSGPARPTVYFREWLRYRIKDLKKYPILKSDFDMNFWPAREVSQQKIGLDRVKALKTGGKPLSLAMYLYAYRNSLYIPAVKAQARLLDKSLGEGTCTEPKFLEL